MKRLCLLRLCAVVMLAVFLASAVPARADEAPAEGAVEEVSYQGLVDMIKDSGSRIVLLNFWATWCAPCRQEIPDLKAIRADYALEDLDMIAVSVDQDLYDLERFVRNTDFNYQIYRGAVEVAMGFGVSSIPRTILYDAGKKQVYSHEGYVDGQSLRAVLDKHLTK